VWQVKLCGPSLTRAIPERLRVKLVSTSAVMLLGITDEESFLQEASSVPLYDPVCVSVAGMSPRHVQKRPERGHR